MTTNKNKIYCIVITYNGSKWIDKCFGSLVSSTIPLDIIAVDNGSSDGTLEIIHQKFPEVNTIEAHQNLGFGSANNVGIKKAYDAGADYENPTKEGITKAINNLKMFASQIRKPEIVEKHYGEIKKIIEKLE